MNQLFCEAELLPGQFTFSGSLIDSSEQVVIRTFARIQADCFFGFSLRISEAIQIEVSFRQLVVHLPGVGSDARCAHKQWDRLFSPFGFRQ